MTATQSGDHAFDAPLWRAIGIFRVVALIYAVVVFLTNQGDYGRRWVGWAVMAVMVVWTAYAGYAFATPSRRTSALLIADLTIATACLLATAVAETPHRILNGASTTPTVWVAAAAFTWGVSGGVRRGGFAAGLMSLAGLAVPVFAGGGLHRTSQSTVNGLLLLFLCGIVAGYIAVLGRAGQARLTRAIEMEAATRERERLARDIHDSVLQVLTLVKRRGGQLGGEAAELARLAGEQEVALRALIGGRDSAPTDPGGQSDLRALLAGYESAAVTVSAPATPVYLPGSTAQEIKAAVGAALDNVRGHCGDGTRVWVLIEDGGPEIVVSVRDDGPGIPEGRLTQAAAEGRLGVAQSIEGRIQDLGGTVTITSAPGQGTEIEMTIPSVLSGCSYRGFSAAAAP